MKKKIVIQCVIYFILGLLVMAAGLKFQGFFQTSLPVEKVRILSDCFLFPGVLFGGLGALSWIAAKGTFDMLGYGFAFFLGPIFNPKKKMESFYEYKMRKEEAGEKWLPQMFVVGLFYLLVSIIFMFVFIAMEG